MPCEGCNCGAADTPNANGASAGASLSAGDGAPGGRVETGGLAGPELNEYTARLARSFTAPADHKHPTEGVEPAVPLRHRFWFNEEAEDMVGCYIERYTNGGLTSECGSWITVYGLGEWRQLWLPLEAKKIVLLSHPIISRR